jgi:hypothetical protein
VSRLKDRQHSKKCLWTTYKSTLPISLHHHTQFDKPPLQPNTSHHARATLSYCSCQLLLMTWHRSSMLCIPKNTYSHKHSTTYHNSAQALAQCNKHDGKLRRVSLLQSARTEEPESTGFQYMMIDGAGKTNAVACRSLYVFYYVYVV